MGSSPPPATDDDRYQDPMWERRTHARILVRDADAGRIIGSAGSSIAAMEKEAGSGARITLSGRDQILAGTDRRVVFLSGPFRAVMDAADLLLHKIPPRYQGEQADNTVVLVVPYACCGALIGKGGTLIKWLAQESNAGITVSHHRLCYGFNDRLVNITGRLEHQLQAIFLILSELLDDVHYLSSYQSVGFPRCHVSSVGCDGDAQDEHVERYHSRATGALITVFKGKLLPGMREREVVISGTREAVDAAEAMIAEHISYAMGRRRGRNQQGGEGRRPCVE